ncbi:ABC transporter permease [Hwanghaeella sp.]|uniref:ABC transporter permease n=1 Tax=Hwanghaeella sp. TaxID=2605943 RepID=UPI003CCC33E2
MIRFLSARLLQSLIVLIVMSFLIYALIGLMPGDPIDLMLSANPDFTSEDAARLKALYGLDQPLLTRYGNWLIAALGGDFGYSRLYSQPVLDVVGPRLANTALLVGISLALSLLLAIPLGIAAAVRPYSPIDYLVNLSCFAGISAPPFWLALMAIMLFSVTLGWFPAGGQAPPGASPWETLQHAVLPIGVLTLASVGGFTRFMRASMVQTLRQDFIRTASAKGLSRTRVVYGHALRNALLPMVTIVALSFGTLFSGALITETMFAWLGMGKTIYDAILGNDFNLALVGLLMATGMTLLGNVLADLSYVALDPRLDFRAEGT